MKKRVFSSLVLGATLLFGGSWNNKSIDIKTYEENIKDTLTMIATKNDSTINFGSGVDGVDTLNIKSMPLEGAFNYIVEKHNLEYKWEGNSIIVTKKKTSQTSLIKLQYLTVDRLDRLLERYLGKKDKNLYKRIKKDTVFDKEMEAIFIKSDSIDIEEFKSLLTELEMAEKLRLEKVAKSEEARVQKGLYDSELEKKREYGLKEFEDWKMIVKIIPLKYINAAGSEIEFKGEKIQVESLEDTLKGLIGTGFVNSDINSSKKSAENGYLKIDKRTNSIIVKDYPDRVDEINEIVKKLDKPIELVEIEVTIVNGSDGFSKQLGARIGAVRKNKSNDKQYGFSTSQNIADNLNQARVTPTIQKTTMVNGIATTETVADSTNTEQINNLDLLQPMAGALGLSSSMLFIGSRSLLNVQLDAMEEEGLGKVLSNPHVVTLNHREATIISGSSVSIPTATQDRMDLETVSTGVSIKATPHIIKKEEVDNNKEDEDIMLEISVEKSSLGSVTSQQIETSQNKVNSHVILKNGQTLVLGGLFDYTKSTTHGGIPLLKDIPLLGLLFSTKGESLNKSELLFFITPRIITSKMVNDMQKSYYVKHTNVMKEEKKKFDKKFLSVGTEEMFKQIYNQGNTNGE